MNSFGFSNRYVISFRLLALALLALSNSALATDIFVSPSGHDTNDGSAQHPLLTLPAAQHLARSTNSDGPLTIHVASGIYYLAQPLVITPEDSGTKRSPVVWQGDEIQPPVISGGQKLQLTWSPYKDGIFQAHVPTEVTTDQLFVDGQRQVLARYPNYDPKVEIFNGWAADAISPQRAARWADPAGGFFHAMHPGLWGGFSYLITGKDAAGNVTMQGGWQGNRPAAPHKQYRYVENIFEELDAPGEWFLNNKTHVLYFYPPAGVDLASATIEVVRLKHLIEFRGTEQSPVRWVSFRGFVLRHTLRTFMETKEPILRSDWTICRGGAVFPTGTEDCALENSFLDQLGGNAVFVNNYNRRFTVRGCRIERCGAGGVMFLGNPNAVRSPLFRYEQRQPLEQIDKTPGPKGNDYPSDCLVEDCLITQVGRVEKQSCGVGIDMSARITVRHCSIYDMPRAGINIGDGCWGGNIVEYCDIFDTVKETGDHGSFNSWGRDRFWSPDMKEMVARTTADPALPLLDAVQPNILRNSRWRCDHGWDIDLDDGSSNYQIYNNLCLHGGIKNREGFARRVENNICLNNTLSAHVWFANSGDQFNHNIIFTDYKPALMCPKPWGASLDYNIMNDPAATTPVPALDLQKQSGRDQHSVHARLTFIDPDKGDFRVPDGSPALALGFGNFPMDQFGVTSAGLRALARTPSFALNPEKRSSRDPTVVEWKASQIRNIIGTGEQSAYGLPGETGVLALTVPAGSPLSDAGVRVGDVITSLEGMPIDDVEALRQSGHWTAGVPFALTVLRGQQSVNLTITK
jgi:hypothetical protein